MDNTYNLINGDCLIEMAKLADNSIDSIVTDPPYELGFMGKSWDSTGIAFNVNVWKEALRVLKPGGHIVAFSGSRTYHRMAVAIEDAGFEIRDQIMWVYGSGFPKSLNVSKAIDKKGGNPNLSNEIGIAIKKAREERGLSQSYCDKKYCNGTTNWSWFEGRANGQRIPSTEQFKKIVNDFSELTTYFELVKEAERAIIGTNKTNLTVYQAIGETNTSGIINITAPATQEAKQWDGWGTALKPAHEPIVLARKPLSEKTVAENVLKWGTGAINIDDCRVTDGTETQKDKKEYIANDKNEVYGKNMGGGHWENTNGRWPANFIHDGLEEEWSRFFYCAKASKKDRNSGDSNNIHSTVKPTDLMAYLCRLVTPPNGLILDPFNGSGSTGKAAVRENFNYIGIDLSQEYLDISKARIENEYKKAA